MTKDKLTKRHLVPRNPVVRDQIANPNRSAGKHREVRRNVERNLNGMSWDDWVEYAERMDVSRKRILMGAQTKYRELYMDEIGEAND